MKKYIIKIFLYSIFCILALSVFANTVFYIHRSSQLFKPAYLINGFDTKDTLDYIILGSSTGLTTLDTNVIDSICGTNGINLSMDDTGLGTYNLMFKHFIESGFRTRFCILTIDVGRLNDTKIGFSNNDYRFLPFINRDYVYDDFRMREHDCDEMPFRSVSHFLPFVGLAYYNQELFYSSMLSLLDLQKRHRFDQRGNYQYPTNAGIEGDMFPAETENIVFANRLIKEIESRCKQNNIKLIYYLTPQFNYKSTYVGEDRLIINHRDLITDETCFYDRMHVTPKGNRIASMSIADILKSIFYK